MLKSLGKTSQTESDPREPQGATRAEAPWSGRGKMMLSGPPPSRGILYYFITRYHYTVTGTDTTDTLIIDTCTTSYLSGTHPCLRSLVAPKGPADCGLLATATATTTTTTAAAHFPWSPQAAPTLSFWRLGEVMIFFDFG